MTKVSACIFFTLILLTLVFVHIGGSFDKQFWLTFLPGLMQNLVILAVAVLVIDGIFKRERFAKLEQTNAGQSQFVLLLSNRSAYLLLEFLSLAGVNEVDGDKALNFEFALERLRLTNLAAVFYEQLMAAENKVAFAEGFESMLSRETEGISKGLDKIYPRPDPTIKQLTDRMQFSIGALGALKGLFEAFNAANAHVRAENQLKPEHLELLVRVAYDQVGMELDNIRSSIIKVSDSARANKLFMPLD